MHAWLAFAAALLTFLLASASAAQYKNFIILIADDVGIERIQAYKDAGVVPSSTPDSETPKIDSLAAEGILFERAYATPGCSPTRAALLTGKHAYWTGIGTNVSGTAQSNNPSLNVAESGGHMTIPQMLDTLGTYESHAFGKWHLAGFIPRVPPLLPIRDDEHPLAAGFDSFQGTFHNITGGLEEDYGGYADPNGSPAWESFIAFRGWPKLELGGSPSEATTTVYATHDTADDVIAKLTDPNLHQPFFYWVAFNAGHVPYHVPPSNLSDGLAEPDPVLLADVDYTLATTFASATSPTNAEMHRAMVEAMDVEIGNILATLDTEGLAGSTTIVFIGDNGTPEDAVDGGIEPTHAKASLYEPGVRAPFIIRSPEIHEDREGASEDAFVSIVDVWRTVGEIAGVNFTDSNDFNAAEDGVDSISLAKFFDPNTADDPHRDELYAERFAPHGEELARSRYERAIRNGSYKLFRKNGLYSELYELAGDPDEEDNLLCGALQGADLTAFNALKGAMEALDNDPGCTGTQSGQDDIDLDGDCDRVDNCTTAPNGLQIDSDTDGAGNACDPDYNNDNVVGGPDFNVFNLAFGIESGEPGYNPAVEFDDNNVIGGTEFNFFRGRFGEQGEDALGPSAPYFDPNGTGIHPPNCP